MQRSAYLIAGLIISILPQVDDWPSWAAVALLAAAFFLILLIVMEFSGHKGHRVYAKTDTEGIKKYMHRWLDHGGRVALWTRDMSWARDRETHELLRAKAQRNELILCMPEANELASQLEQAGAEVCIYGKERLDSPSSRFTITFFGRDGSQIAIGRAQADTHVIDEFSAAEHPAFHVAEDLIALVRSLQEKPSR